jgi:hypothetical protein
MDVEAPSMLLLLWFDWVRVIFLCFNRIAVRSETQKQDAWWLGFCVGGVIRMMRFWQECCKRKRICMGEDFQSCTLVLPRCRLVGIVLFLQCIYGMFVGVTWTSGGFPLARNSILSLVTTLSHCLFLGC